LCRAEEEARELLRRLTVRFSQDTIVDLLNELGNQNQVVPLDIDRADVEEISDLTANRSVGTPPAKEPADTETQASEVEAQIHEGVVGNVLELTGPTSAGPFSITETQALAGEAQIHKEVVEDVSLVTVDLGSTKG
jgi:hypothetical protein